MKLWLKFKTWVDIVLLGKIPLHSVWAMRVDEKHQVEITFVSDERIRYTYLPYKLAETSLTRDAFRYVYRKVK